MLRREQSRLPGKRKETMLNRNMRNTAILLVVFLAVYMFGNYFAEKNLMSGSGSSSYSYERLESDIAKNKVKSIEVVQNAQVPTGSAIVKLNDGEKKVAHVTDVNKVIDLAQQYKVSCQVDDVKSSDAGWLSMILPWIVIGVIMMFMFGMISRASGGGGGGNKMMNFGKSRAKMQDPESQNIRFDQVAGLQEEKEELKEESGLSGAEFCHKGGFLMTTSTLEDAIKACKISQQQFHEQVVIVNLGTDEAADALLFKLPQFSGARIVHMELPDLPPMEWDGIYGESTLEKQEWKAQIKDQVKKILKSKPEAVYVQGDLFAVYPLIHALRKRHMPVLVMTEMEGEQKIVRIPSGS